MRRSPLKPRGTALKSDPEKTRAFVQRGRDNARERERAGPITLTCEACGEGFTVRWPSQVRKGCSPRCSAELTARAKRGGANPMKREAVAAKVSAARAARQLQRDADIPSAPTKCARPGCPAPPGPGGAVYCSPRCHYDDRGRQGGAGRKRAQPYHRCRNCGTVFAWNGAGKGAYCSAKCKRGAPRSADPEVVDVVVLRGHMRADWNAGALGRCAGCGSRAQHRHHIVFDQHVRRYGGDRWDPRNQLHVCTSCHASLHGSLSLPLALLSDAAYAFASELLGSAAYDYLRRRYGGADPRHEAMLISDVTSTR